MVYQFLKPAFFLVVSQENSKKWKKLKIVKSLDNWINEWLSFWGQNRCYFDGINETENLRNSAQRYCFLWIQNDIC